MFKVRYKSPEDFHTHYCRIDMSSSTTRPAPTSRRIQSSGTAELAFVLIQLDLHSRVRSDQAFALDQPIKVGDNVACSQSVPVHDQRTTSNASTRDEVHTRRNTGRRLYLCHALECAPAKTPWTDS
jgi:hypothetical protein